MAGSPPTLSLELTVSNHSGEAIRDFDLMLNKNPFGIAIYGVAGELAFPPPGDSATKVFRCTIDKKNLDAKNPPKHPFQTQVALRSSLDIFYFEVPCLLHCLIDHANPMKPDEFKKFWEMIPKANEGTVPVPALYPGFISLNSGDLPGNLAQGLAANGFSCLARVPKKDSSSIMLYLGAKTINNLPLLLEVAAGAGAVQVLYRVPVLPLRPMLEEALTLVLSADARQQ